MRSSKQYQLVCITKNGTNPAYQGARIGARRVAEAAGHSVTSYFPQKPDDVSEQIELLKDALATQPDAILLAPAHPTAMNATIEKVRAAAIPLVTFVSRPQGIEPDCFVTSDNYALAYEIAQHLIARLNGVGKIVIIEGSPASETSPPRTQGFRDAAAQYSGIEIIASGIGNYQRDDARQAMKTILAQCPEIDGVLCANDYMGIGVIDAMIEAGRHAPIVSVNAMPDAIKALHDGQLVATAAFDAMKIACAATHAAIRLLSGQPVPGVIELPVEIVTAENCAGWDKPYETRDLPRWSDLVPEKS